MLKLAALALVCTTAAVGIFTPNPASGDEQEKPKSSAKSPLVVDGKLVTSPGSRAHGAGRRGTRTSRRGTAIRPVE